MDFDPCACHRAFAKNWVGYNELWSNVMDAWDFKCWPQVFPAKSSIQSWLVLNKLFFFSLVGCHLLKSRIKETNVQKQNCLIHFVQYRLKESLFYFDKGLWTWQHAKEFGRGWRPSLVTVSCHLCSFQEGIELALALVKRTN